MVGVSRKAWQGPAVPLRNQIEKLYMKLLEPKDREWFSDYGTATMQSTDTPSVSI